MAGGFNGSCLDVQVFHVCGQQAKALIRRDIKETRRRRKLRWALAEIRKLRHELRAARAPETEER